MQVNLIKIGDFFKSYKWAIIYTASFIVFMMLVKKCESEPEVIIKTEIKEVPKIETITKTIIKEVPKIVYVERIKIKKGKDSIIYRDKPTNNTTKANQFNSTIKTDKASAKLKITTTGQLIDVTGVISYPEVTKTVTKTTIKAKSGLFIYADMPINHNSINIGTGVIYQFKNKLLLKGGIQYNDITQTANFNVGIGIKIF